MGVGGVTALGCTIGQGLSGIVAGALAAFRYRSWRLDRIG